MKCDMCDSEAEFHIANFDDNQKSRRHFCRAHAPQLGAGHATIERDLARGVASNLRKLIAFIKREDRMPSSIELAAIGASGDIATMFSCDDKPEEHLSS